MLNTFLIKTLISIANVLEPISQAYFSEATLSTFVVFETIVTIDYEHLDVVVDSGSGAKTVVYNFSSVNVVSDIQYMAACLLNHLRSIIRDGAN